MPRKIRLTGAQERQLRDGRRQAALLDELRALGWDGMEPPRTPEDVVSAVSVPVLAPAPRRAPEPPAPRPAKSAAPVPIEPPDLDVEDDGIAAQLGAAPDDVAGMTAYAHRAAGLLLESVLRARLPLLAKLKHAKPLIDAIGETSVQALKDERIAALENDLRRVRGDGNGTAKASAEPNPARALVRRPAGSA